MTLLVPGKSCGKESPDKKDDSELWSNVEAQAAFLGPNLWEKTLSYDSDLKVSQLFFRFSTKKKVSNYRLEKNKKSNKQFLKLLYSI